MGLANLQFKRHALLTGAGFTKNFDGLLGEEIWARIFNHTKIQDNKKLRDLLIELFDYEHAYQVVFSDSTYTDADKEDFTKVLENVYDNLDTRIRRWGPSHSAVNWGKFRHRLLDKIAGSKDQYGVIFTLNQDFFMERHQDSSPKLFRSPNVNYQSTFNEGKRHFQLEKEDFIVLPTNLSDSDAIAGLADNRSLYLKLHGSFNWLGDGGKRLMITGQDKAQIIHSIPLLDWYWKLFCRFTDEENRKLLIIGYGFRDPHINAQLALAIKSKGLKLYIVSPIPFTKLLSSVDALVDEHGENVSMTIKDGLAGYYQGYIRDIFPMNETMAETSNLLKELDDGFFRD